VSDTRRGADHGNGVLPEGGEGGVGIPCNQSNDSGLWVGKGCKRSLAGQLGQVIATAVQRVLTGGRGDRRGRFWVDLETKTVTMMVGDSNDNEVDTYRLEV